MSTIDGGSGGLAILDEPAAPAPEPEVENSRKKLYTILGIIAALLLLVIAIFVWYLLTHKSLTQLPGINKLYAPPTYKSSIYGVDQPVGVAVSADGQLVYVTQSGGKRTTLEFDRTGKLLATLTPPKATGAAHVPVYPAVNPTNGDVYVSDRMTQSIYIYNSSGKYQRAFKPTGVKLPWSPLGLGFDKDGNLYVSEVGGKAHQVLVFDTAGKLTRTITTKPTAMSFPNGIAVDAQGHILITDSNNGRLLLFGSDALPFASVNRGIGTGDLGLPRGISVDPEGRISIVDSTNQQVNVYKLNDDGSTVNYLGTFGTEGIQNGQFEYPNGIATDSSSTIYVTDRENGRVQIWGY